MKTRTDIVHQTLRNLGALPVGQSPSAEEYAVVNDLIDGLLAELEALDVIYIDGIDTVGVEEKYFQPLARILTWRAAPAFGAQGDQNLHALAEVAVGALNEMDRLEVRYTHDRTMWSDYPLGYGIVSNSTIAF